MTYYDDGKSGYCCWDLRIELEEGTIQKDEDQYFKIKGSEHPLFCCPYCGSIDFKTNPRRQRMNE